ncbi:hypothetical protein L1987_54691 [Smallanthus sonchifolius]|uniref:Uncharacterized protein n=1 Tax=Smallanthus sonchifolius TaxID=185202 RepID=A0ACB9E7G8_9ASTR|nr:hypothetical protein L1987_54691 [Smallanthus sonchifolius]
MTNFPKSRRDLLEKQFMFFKYLEDETVDDIVSRYYHLLRDLVKCDVSYTNIKVNEKLLDALPPKFEKYSVLIKKSEDLTDMSLEELIDTVYSYEKGDATKVSDKSDSESDCFSESSDRESFHSSSSEINAKAHIYAGSDNSSLESDSSESRSVAEIEESIIQNAEPKFSTKELLDDGAAGKVTEKTAKIDLKQMHPWMIRNRYIRKLERYKNSSFLLEYYNEKASGEKVVGGVGSCPSFDNKAIGGGVGYCPPFNGNYTSRTTEIVTEDDLEPKTILKVDELVVVKKLTRDRCILTEPDEDIEQPQPKPVKKFVSSGFHFQENNKIEKISTLDFIKNKVDSEKPKVVQVSNTASQYESSTSRSVKQEKFVRVYKERRTSFHCGVVGHILVNCPYKNVGKRLEDPKLGRPFVKPPAKPVVKSVLVKKPDVSKPEVKVSYVPVKPKSQIQSTKYVNQTEVSSSRGSRDMTPKASYEKKFIERRTCFYCGVVGHVCVNCPSTTLSYETPETRPVVTRSVGRNFVGTESLNSKSKVRLSRPQRRRRNRRLRTLLEQQDVLQYQNVSNEPECSNTSLFKRKELHAQKSVWKRKVFVSDSMGQSPKIEERFNCELREVIYFDTDGRPRTTMAWVSISD